MLNQPGDQDAGAKSIGFEGGLLIQNQQITLFFIGADCLQLLLDRG